MKAVVCQEYGPPEVLHVSEVARPVPRANEVLIRIHASTVTIEDPRMRSGFTSMQPVLRLLGRAALGFRRPRRVIPGFEFAGEVESIGNKVKRFRSGDQVYGYTGLAFGAQAEYKCMPENGVLAAKPNNMSYGQAAAIPNGALTALVFLRNKARIQPGEQVLIIGASGSVGTFAVQLAKHFGAEVTGVCSTSNLALVESLGADHVIDYTQEDFTQNRRKYDIIFDTVSKSSFSRCKHSLQQDGRYLVTDIGLAAFGQTLWTRVAGGKRAILASSNFSWTAEDLDFLRILVEAGQVTSVIDRCYPLDQIVAAHRYVEKGHKKGNVIVAFEHNDDLDKT